MAANAFVALGYPVEMAVLSLPAMPTRLADGLGLGSTLQLPRTLSPP